MTLSEKAAISLTTQPSTVVHGISFGSESYGDRGVKSIQCPNLMHTEGLGTGNETIPSTGKKSKKQKTRNHVTRIN